MTRLALIIGGLAIQSILAYTLLPEGRGAYAICVMFGTLFGVLFTLGVDRGVQYYLMAKKISVSDAVWVSIVICFIGSTLAIIVAVSLILSDIRFFQNADRSSFFLSLSLIPLTAFSTSMGLQLAGLRRFGWLATYSVLQVVTNVFVLIALVFGLNLSVEGALVAVATGHIVMIVGVLGHLRGNYELFAALPSPQVFGRIVRYGIKYHFARTGQVVDVQIGAIVLGMIAGRAEIGMFAVASALLTRMWIVSEATSSAILPRIAAEKDGRPTLVSFCSRVTSWITGIALVFLCAVSVPLTRTLLSEAFLPAVPLMWIMAPGVLVYSGTSVLMAYFRGVNRPGVCSWAVWAGLVANLSTIALLYSQLGVAAAAWGLAVGRVCRSIVIVLVYHQVAHMSPVRLWIPQQGDVRRIWDLGKTAISRTMSRRSSGT